MKPFKMLPAIFARIHRTSGGESRATDGALPHGCIIRRKLALLSKEQIGSVKQVVAQHLTDRDSALFRNIYDRQIIYESGEIDHCICGQVNGKDRFGGYTGFRYFYGAFDGAEQFVLDRIDEDRSACGHRICA